MTYLIGICLMVAGLALMTQEYTKEDDLSKVRDAFNNEINRVWESLGAEQRITSHLDDRLMEFEQVPYVKKIKNILKVKYVTRDGTEFYFHNKKELEKTHYGYYYDNQYKRRVSISNLKSTYEELEKNKKELGCEEKCEVGE